MSPRATESETTDPLEGPSQSLDSQSEDAVATTCNTPGNLHSQWQVILLIHTHVHVGLASDPIQTESSTGEATAVECDIGKLLHLGKDLHSLHRDDKYRI